MSVRADTEAQLERDVIPRHRPAFEPQALDLPRLLLEGVPEVECLLGCPYLPAGARVWAWGPTESGKSLWTAWIAAALTRSGRSVVYLSEENPLQEDLRRLERLRPDLTRLRFFHGQGWDLGRSDHVQALIRESASAALVVVDTLSACWSGDENENAAITALDRDALQPLVQQTGATVLLLDHAGHDQAFVKRRGASGGRGASAKGQKSDVALDFRPGTEPGEFTIEHGKNRLGGRKEPKRTFRVVDTDDGSLDVQAVDGSAAARELAEAMVEAVQQSADGFLTSKGLREAVKGHGGKELQDEAMALLRGEEPPRVWLTEGEVVPTGRGRQRANTWRPA